MCVTGCEPKIRTITTKTFHKGGQSNSTMDRMPCTQSDPDSNPSLPNGPPSLPSGRANFIGPGWVWLNNNKIFHGDVSVWELRDKTDLRYLPCMWLVLVLRIPGMVQGPIRPIRGRSLAQSRASPYSPLCVNLPHPQQCSILARKKNQRTPAHALHTGDSGSISRNTCSSSTAGQDL